MDTSSLIKTPIAAELDDFKKLFDSSLTSSNFLLNEVISHILECMDSFRVLHDLL